jgi:tRNA (guanine37-N1)-methyltransferase
MSPTPPIPLRIDILTTFPEMFAPPAIAPSAALNVSIPGRAAAAGLVEWHATNIRDFAGNKHDKTDDRPFGGGPGMVMMCQPVYDAVLAAEARDARPATRILMTPAGKPLTQALARELASKPRLLIIAGHYEGLDQRVIDTLAPLEISIGDYILSGGELAAMVLIDAIVRLIPGAVGDEASIATESFEPVSVPGKTKKAPATIERLLDCPHYTRPREWMGQSVPDVLLSGDHAAVDAWRLSERLRLTRQRRPDLLAGDSSDKA